MTYLFAVTNSVKAQAHVVPSQLVRVIEFSGLFEVIQGTLEVLLFVVDQTSLMIDLVVLLQINSTREVINSFDIVTTRSTSLILD